MAVTIMDRRSGALDRRRQPHVSLSLGTPERRSRYRRASDVPKVTCPYCGSATSVVYRSQKRPTTDDRYHRRRVCGDCQRTWPTFEETNWDRLTQELASEGKTLADLGFTPHLGTVRGQARR